MAASVLVPRLESGLARNLLIFAVTPLPYFALQNGSPYSAVFPLLLIAVLAAIAAKPLFAGRRPNREAVPFHPVERVQT